MVFEALTYEYEKECNRPGTPYITIKNMLITYSLNKAYKWRSEWITFMKIVHAC
jgi:hypothetical protein